MSLLDANSREDLFDELKFDRAKPAEAEAEATRRGWAPLAPEPDIAAYDPLAEQQWTFPMAMAWISMRSVDAVRLAWNKYRARYPIWRRDSWRDGPGGEVHRGWLLYHLEPATSLGLELLAIVGGMEEDGKPAVMSVADARDALWSIRTVFQRAFLAAGLPYFNPHSFRKTVTRLGMELPLSDAARKAWSQNLGHDDVMVTMRSYGELPRHQQHELIKAAAYAKEDDALALQLGREMLASMRAKKVG